MNAATPHGSYIGDGPLQDRAAVQLEWSVSVALLFFSKDIARQTP